MQVFDHISKPVTLVIFPASWIINEFEKEIWQSTAGTVYLYWS